MRVLHYQTRAAATAEGAIYLRAIKAVGKGRAKKAQRAAEDLEARLSDPAQGMLRRLWWGRVSWERILGDLQQAASIGPPSASELLSAYRLAWESAQQDWDRWEEHFWHLRADLRTWLDDDGIVAAPVDLTAEKPEQELRVATKEFRKALKAKNRERPGNDSPQQARAELALILDPTLQFDVMQGDTFLVQDSTVTWTFPWEQRWPHESQGMGEKGTSEPLLGTVVKLTNGTGRIRSGQQWFEETSEPSSILKHYRYHLVLVCDASLIVMEWHSGAKQWWTLVDAFPYHMIDTRGAIGKGRIAAVDPDTGKKIWAVPGLRRPIVDALLEAKADAASS